MVGVGRFVHPELELLVLVVLYRSPFCYVKQTLMEAGVLAGRARAGVSFSAADEWAR